MSRLFRELPSRKILFGTTISAAVFFMVIGVIFWGGFNTAMEATNTLEFCISCHEMEENVYQEYKKTIHYSNRAGVRATCSDCHVPRPWVHKVVRKIQASNEVFHKLLGTIDTPEKFNDKRLSLARNVWRTMKSTDSRECRNCHDFSTMNPANQKSRARKQHLNAMKAGNTCIDCHKGIAHNKVHDQLPEEELEAMEAPMPEFIRPLPPQWLAFEENGNKKPAAKVVSIQAPAPTPVADTSVVKKAAPVVNSNSRVDWSKAALREVTVFYPGQSSIEWVMGRQHGGKRAVKSGDRCFDCHEEELADIGKKIVSGEKEMKVGKDKNHGMEPTLIPGKRGSFPVQVQSTYDSENLYLRFQWADSEHTPAPFIDGGKMDPANKVKLAIMLATDDVKYADRAGCWGTCHADLRSMPFAPEKEAIAGSPLASMNSSNGITKYITESRTKLEFRGRGGKALGGWNKVKDEAELKAEFEAGHYMELHRYKAGEKISENGHILEDRTVNDGMAVEFTASLNKGTWTVEMVRKLKSDKPGDLKLDTATVYNFGFAIHDDYTSARYHHVSLGYKLGFDNAEAEINVLKQ